MIYTIKNFIIGIANIFRYFKLIWEDRDWDHGYVEHLLYFKYKRMYARFIDPNKTFVDWTGEAKKDLQALKITLIILERRDTDWYMDVLPEDFTREEALAVYDIEQRDWKILCKLQEQYFETWWD